VRFKQYYLTEKKVSPEFFEKAIVRSWNGLPVKKEIKPAAESITAILRAKNLKGKARQIGRERFALTKEWKQYGGTNRTPKADILIGNSNISIKLKPSAQLMSGGKEESLATFMSIVDNIKTEPKLDTLVKKVKSDFDLFTKGIIEKKTITDILEKGEDVGIKKANQLHKKIMDDLSSMFSEDVRIGYGFVKEAISGYNKFGKESDASADYVLAFNREGKRIGFNSVDDNKYIDKIYKQTKLNVRFKSKKIPKGYTYWSVMSLVWKNFKECTEQYKGQLLTEGILGDIISKIKTFIVSTFNKIISFISKNLSNFLAFFNLSTEVMFNNMVTF
jgi:hypothetical protein